MEHKARRCSGLIMIFFSNVMFAKPPALPNFTYANNVCYQNALVQSMNALASVVDYIVKNRNNEFYNNNEILSAYADLIIAMQENKEVKKAAKAFYDSGCLVLREKGFLKNEQQDAAMLFRGLLEQFQTEKPVPGIAHLFRMTIDYNIICNNKTVSSKNEEDFELKIPVIGGNLRDCFEKMSKGSEVDKYEDDFGNKHYNCTRQPKLQKLPDILLLIVERFVPDVFDKDFNMLYIAKKESIDIPVRLTKNYLAPLLADKEMNVDDYDLGAIVMHHGSTPNSGHYAAYIKDPKDGLWYWCSDSSIVEIGKDLKIYSNSSDYTKDCYMLFYVKSKKEDKTAAAKVVNSFGQALNSIAKG